MPKISEELIWNVKNSVDGESLLKALGFKIFKNNANDIRCPCLIHGGDNPTAFSFRSETNKWNCFTKKCEVAANGSLENDVISLVMKVSGVSFVQAVQYLADFSGLRIDVKDSSFEETEEFRRKKDTTGFVKLVKRVSSYAKSLATIDEQRVQSYINSRNDFFLKQGFLPETLEYFEIGSKVDDYGVLRATIPIRDAAGRLISVSARRQDGDEEPRYLLDEDFNKSRTLYNLHNVKAGGYDTVIIVEGFKALWALHEAGIKNVVACMGSVVVPGQIATLCMSGIRNCLLLLDGDDAGFEGMETSAKNMKKYFKVECAYLPKDVSPDDFSRKDLFDFVELYLNLF